MKVAYAADFQRAVEFIGRRWTGVVVRALMDGPIRFNDLLSGIPGISDRVLTERLRELADAGLVERSVFIGPPIRVEYRITARGRSLAGVFAAIDAWAAADRQARELAS
jgi:DNA-binding HxlR family transcriptional regulator